MYYAVCYYGGSNPLSYVVSGRAPASALATMVVAGPFETETEAKAVALQMERATRYYAVCLHGSSGIPGSLSIQAFVRDYNPAQWRKPTADATTTVAGPYMNEADAEQAVEDFYRVWRESRANK